MGGNSGGGRGYFWQPQPNLSPIPRVKMEICTVERFRTYINKILGCMYVKNASDRMISSFIPLCKWCIFHEHKHILEYKHIILTLLPPFRHFLLVPSIHKELLLFYILLWIWLIGNKMFLGINIRV